MRAFKKLEIWKKGIHIVKEIFNLVEEESRMINTFNK